MAETCPFCAIVAHEAPARFHAEYPHSIVIEPLNPVTAGHLLVISREHVPNFAWNPDVTAKVMCDAAFYARLFCDCNLITSRGLFATQTVFHLHVHLVPRWAGDGLALPWTDQERAS